MSNVKPKSTGRGGLSDVHLKQVKRLLDPLCVPHPEARVRDQLRYGYRVEGPAVVFFESRPRYDRPSDWLDHEIAKFRFTKSTGQWTLYCQFRDLKWRAYQPFPHAADLAELVAEMRRDPTCIFFG